MILWISAAAFGLTVILTFLALLNKVKLGRTLKAHDHYVGLLFRALVLEIVVAGAAAFAKHVNWSPIDGPLNGDRGRVKVADDQPRSDLRFSNVVQHSGAVSKQGPELAIDGSDGTWWDSGLGMASITLRFASSQKVTTLTFKPHLKPYTHITHQTTVRLMNENGILLQEIGLGPDLKDGPPIPLDVRKDLGSGLNAIENVREIVVLSHFSLGNVGWYEIRAQGVK